MAGILVVAEPSDGGVGPISFELLGAARMLSGQGGGNVSAVIAGSEAQAKELIASGADAAFAASNVAGAGGTVDAWLPAIEQALSQSGATIVLLGQTSLGRD